MAISAFERVEKKLWENRDRDGYIFSFSHNLFKSHFFFIFVNTQDCGVKVLHKALFLLMYLAL